jgi:hypothetical protein
MTPFTFRLRVPMDVKPPSFMPHAVMVCRIRVGIRTHFMEVTFEKLGEDELIATSVMELPDFDAMKDFEFGWMAEGVFLLLAV